MARWNIVVYTETSHYRYTTDSTEQKTIIIDREKSKKEVIYIDVNKIRCYRRKN